MSNPGVTDPPVTDVDYEDLGMTAVLILELLAARHRLGESVWTLPDRRGMRKQLAGLADAGWLSYKPGVIGRTWLAWLTDAGRLVLLSGSYEAPITRDRTEATS